MKRMKSTAMILSAAMLCAQMPAFPAVSAFAASVPAWVPQDLEQAVEYQNTYGTTHAEDGVYCIVQRIESDMNPKCDEHLAEGSAECIFKKEIMYEPTDGMPDLDSMSAKERAEWEEKLAKQEMIAECNKNVHYFVSVWKPTKADNNEVIRQIQFQGNGEADVTQPAQVSYTFTAADDTLQVAETGWRAHVPDCKTEYEAFVKEHGNFYIEGDFLIVAGSVNYSTGADMKMQVTLNDSKEKSADHVVNCKKTELLASAGNAEDYVRYYQFKFGETGHAKAQINWTESAPGHERQATFYFSSKMVTNGNTYKIILEKEDPRPDEDLPSWVPTDFSTACAFHNQYGTSHAEDGLICIISRFDTTEEMDENAWLCTPLAGAADAPADCTQIARAFYPMKYQYDHYDNMTHYYYVSVWKPTSAGTVALYGENTGSGSKMKNEDLYTFVVDENLNITETDWRAYVPDCEQERRAFLTKYGGSNGLSDDSATACNIDGSDDYLVFVSQDVAMIGSYMEPGATLDGEKLTLTRVNCDRRWDEIEPTDSTGAFASYCKITKPGTIKASFVRRYQNKNTTVTEQTLDAVKNTAGVISVVRRPDETVPVSTPNSFEKAEEFFKYYGIQYAQSGKLILCLPYTVSDDFRYVLDDPGTAGGTAAHKRLSLEEYTEGNKGYLVAVYQVTSSGNFGMKWLRCPQEGSSVAQMRLYTLSFEVDEKLIARESEATASLPESYDAADKWLSENGSVTVKDGFIYCGGNTNPSTGYSIIPEITGTAVVDAVTKCSFGKETGSPGASGGGRSNEFFQFKPVMPGLLKVTVRHAREWELNTGEVLATKFYEVADDLTVKEIQLTEGDLNGDNKLTTADAVSLSKYLGGQLTGKSALSEKQFLAADMRADGRLNAADLSVMKQQLMKLNDTETPAA